jgi:hypothetical protein
VNGLVTKGGRGGIEGLQQPHQVIVGRAEAAQPRSQ